MEIIFEYHNIRRQKRLSSIAIKKLNKLLEKYPFVVRAQVFLKEENHPKEKRHISGIRLSAPGPLLFASSNCNNFLSAVNKTLKNLNTQLQKRKAIMYTN